jgi:hypothetical protein
VPELLIELSRERLVVHHHERGPVHPGDRLRHRVGLARAGDAQQYLMLIAALQTVHELAERALLIAGERKVGDEVEAVVQGGHTNSPWY